MSTESEVKVEPTSSFPADSQGPANPKSTALPADSPGEQTDKEGALSEPLQAVEARPTSASGTMSSSSPSTTTTSSSTSQSTSIVTRSVLRRTLKPPNKGPYVYVSLKKGTSQKRNGTVKQEESCDCEDHRRSPRTKGLQSRLLQSPPYSNPVPLATCSPQAGPIASPTGPRAIPPTGPLASPLLISLASPTAARWKSPSQTSPKTDTICLVVGGKQLSPTIKSDDSEEMDVEPASVPVSPTAVTVTRPSMSTPTIKTRMTSAGVTGAASPNENTIKTRHSKRISTPKTPGNTTSLIVGGRVMSGAASPSLSQQSPEDSTVKRRSSSRSIKRKKFDDELVESSLIKTSRGGSAGGSGGGGGGGGKLPPNTVPSNTTIHLVTHTLTHHHQQSPSTHSKPSPQPSPPPPPPTPPQPPQTPPPSQAPKAVEEVVVKVKQEVVKKEPEPSPPPPARTPPPSKPVTRAAVPAHKKPVALKAPTPAPKKAKIEASQAPKPPRSAAPPPPSQPKVELSRPPPEKKKGKAIPSKGSSKSSRSKKSKSFVPLARETSRWTAEDDLALITAVHQTNDLEQVFQGVKFSHRFSMKEIEERWYALLYDPIASKASQTAMRLLHPDIKIAIMAKALYSEREEKILAAVASTSQPTADTFQELINSNSTVFNPMRTAKSLQKHWLTMKQYHLLPDQTVQPMPRGDHVLNFSDAEDMMDDSHLQDPRDEILEHELAAFDRRQKRQIRHLENEIPKWQVLVENVTGMTSQEFDSQTLAVLRGRLVRYLMRSKEITIGRSSKENTIDVDLSLEGPAWKVSRKQGVIKLRNNGEFYLANEGKRAVHIDGKPVLKGQKWKLTNNAVVEIAGLRFIFLVNQDVISTMRTDTTTVK